MEPKFNINDRVKLVTDNIIYIVTEVIEEKYKFQYRISSEDDNEYRLLVDEIQLTLLD